MRYTKFSIYYWSEHKIHRTEQNSSLALQIQQHQHLAGVGRLAGVDPLVIHVDGFGEKVYSCLEIFQTHCTLYLSCVLGLVHLHLAAHLVVAEGAGELSVQCLNVLSPGFWLTLGLSSSHYEILGLFLEEKNINKFVSNKV